MTSTEVRPLIIALDETALASGGARLLWSLRLFLVSAGFAWRQVSYRETDMVIDLAIGMAPPSKKARLFISFANDRWQSPYTDKTMVNAMLRDIVAATPRGDGLFGVWAQAGQTESGVRDVLFDLYFLVSGQCDNVWDHDKSSQALQGTIKSEGMADVTKQAVASLIINQLAKVITRDHSVSLVPRWPHGYTAAACLSHDVDYPEVVRWLEPLRILKKSGFRNWGLAWSVAIGKKSHWHFASWLAVEAKRGMKSAFYFVPRKGSLVEYGLGTPDSFYDVRSKRFRELFKALKDKGWEVGIHASFRACESEETFAKQIARLEECSGQKVLGGRHHYWRLLPGNPQATLLMHERLGLLYDSSLGHERTIGWRRHMAWPFHPFIEGEGRETRTLQIPPVWMDDHLFGYKHLNPGDSAEILRSTLNATIELGGCLMVDVHDYVFDDDLYPGWSKLYLGLLDDIKSRPHVWRATPGEVAKHWLDRERYIETQSHGLTSGS